jgi:hypothetical protein
MDREIPDTPESGGQRGNYLMVSRKKTSDSCSDFEKRMKLKFLNLKKV